MTNFNLNRPGSTNKFSKYNNTSNFRLVSQNEIYEFIKENPEMSEPEIIYYVYGYKRHKTYYEERYAEGFRRALEKYDIQRKPGVNKLTGKKAYVYFTKEFMDETINDFKEKYCNVKNDTAVVEKQTPKSLLKNFDIVQFGNGKLFLVNIDGCVFISLFGSKEFINFDTLYDDLCNEFNYDWDVKVVYKPKPYLLQYINANLIQYMNINEEYFIRHCDVVWERYEPKRITYSVDEIKELLGIDERDILVVK